MDQGALDYQYNNRAHVPDPQRYLQWYATTSERARARVGHVRDIPYGPLPDQRLDIFMPPGETQRGALPVVIFVHGGAWQHLSLADSSFAAEPFTARGAIYVALGFTRMPSAASLDEMVAQVRAGIAWVWLNIEKYGGNPAEINVLGHSSGAHLTAMAVCADWPRLFGLPQTLIKSAAGVSGLYDLEPVRLSFRNEVLKLDRAAEIRNSPYRNLPAQGAPFLIAYGEGETAEFKRQSEAFYTVWQRRFQNAQLLELKNMNHYETIESVMDEGTALTESVVDWFALKR